MWPQTIPSAPSPAAPSALPAGLAAIPTQVPMFPVPLPVPVELEPYLRPPGAVPGFQSPLGLTLWPCILDLGCHLSRRQTACSRRPGPGRRWVLQRLS